MSILKVTDLDQEAALKLLTPPHIAIQHIGFEAWEASKWLRDIADQRDLVEDVTSEELAMRAFNPYSIAKLAAQSDRIKHALENDRLTTYWLGVPWSKIPRSALGCTRPRNTPRVSVPSVFAQGFAKITQPEVGERVHIHDLNASPFHQRKNLATSIAYVALGEQPQDAVVTLLTAVANGPMRTWAERYGFKESGRKIDKEMLGLPVEMVRYLAPTVAAVRYRMEQRQPWLTKAS